MNEGTQGPPIWDLVMAHIAKKKTVAPQDGGQGGGNVRVVGI